MKSLLIPRSLKKAQKKLKALQKSLSRKVNGSNNRYKAQLNVARLHEKGSDIRQDNLYKITTELIQENQRIDVERKGDEEESLFSSSDRQCELGELIRQLAYKATWYWLWDNARSRLKGSD